MKRLLTKIIRPIVKEEIKEAFSRRDQTLISAFEAVSKDKNQKKENPA